MILSIDGKSIKDPRELTRLIADADIGKSLDLIVLREKEKRSVKVQVGEMPAS